MFRKKDQILRSEAKDKVNFSFAFIHKILPIVIVIISMFLATQRLARQINYDNSILGKPLFIFRKEPYYPFWSIITAYFSAIGAKNKIIGELIYDNGKIVVVGTFFAVISYVILVYVRKFNTQEDKQFTTKNRLGTNKDLIEEGLRDEYGVVFGQDDTAVVEASMRKGGVSVNVISTSQLICYDKNVSAMFIAGSRLGKGLTCVLPSHFLFNHSLISVDPKGENYEISAGYRQTFSYIFKFSPTSKNTLRFNFLDEIDEANPFRDANTIAEILTAPADPEAHADPHWSQKAKVLISATILHIKCCNEYEEKSLPAVYDYLTSANGESDDKTDIKKELLRKMIKSRHCREDVHRQVVKYANEILSAADEEMGSIFSAALGALSIFNDDLVVNCTKSSDFCLNDFKYTDIPISLYLTIPFPDMDRLKSLTRLLIEFICRKFSQGLTKHGDETLKIRILFLIDEFPVIGKCSSIEIFAGILNGYGVSFLWICQSKSQIDKLYGQDAPIFEHCRYICTFAMSNHAAAEYFSNRAGKRGAIKQNTSTSGSKYDFGMNSITVSNDITEVPIISADEIETLRPDCMLIFVQGGYTHIAKKVAYYSDPRFNKLTNWPKPETRKELLLETKNSHVVRKGQETWCTKYDKETIDQMTDASTPDYDAGNIARKVQENDYFEENKNTKEYDPAILDIITI